MIPSPEQEDGVDFINIYSRGRTELGRWLSNFAHSPVDLPEHGHFESIEGYWYWLGTKDDRLRSLVGFQAKQLGRQIRSDKEIELVEGFEDMIRSAIDVKLKTRPEMMRSLAFTELPLVHFYEWKGKRVDAGYEWIIAHIDLRRQQLFEYFSRKDSKRIGVTS